MKKYLLSFIFILALGLGLSSQPCIPDQTLTQPGFSPDSATNLPPGMLGVFYETVISAKIPVQETIGTLTGDVDSVRIVGVGGLPQGFVWETNSATNTWPKDALGCMKISGLPNAEGVFPLKVYLKIWGKAFSMPVTLNDTVEFYRIVIGPASVNDLNSDKISLLNTYPNPANEIVNFEINSSTNRDIDIRIVNIVGVVVVDKKFKLRQGKNNIQLNLNGISRGLYFYQISDGKTVITKKLHIEN